VFRFVMLGGSLHFVVAQKRGNGRTYLAPPSFCCEDIGTMGTTESMVCFAVLGGYQVVYLVLHRIDWQQTNLIHHALRGEVFGTARAFKHMLGVVVLGSM
jgi:hypothetical protein